MQHVLLLTGGNKGDRIAHLSEAKERISSVVGDVLQASGIYETAPWGNADQPAFLNQALEVSTILSPDELLSTLLDIETAMGRTRMEKWGSREIDIDILFYGSGVVNEAHLVIPHPEIPQRRFVLEPLSEIAPYWLHPVLGLDVQTLLLQTRDTLPVRRL